MQADGICGLGFNQMGNSLNIIDSLQKEGVINRRIFAFFFNPTFNSYNSELTIGNYDKRFMKGNIEFYKLVSNKA